MDFGVADRMQMAADTQVERDRGGFADLPRFVTQLATKIHLKIVHHSLHSINGSLYSFNNSVCYERSETAAGFSAEDLKRAEARWREQGSPNGLTSC